MEIALDCPQCGGLVNLDEDDFVFRCEYCDTVLKPTGRNDVQSFFFPPKGTLAQVGRALLKAYAKKGKRVRVRDPRLVYAPYWRVRGLLFEWVFGRKVERGLYGATSYDLFKKLRAVAYHRTFPCFKASRWPMISLGLRAQVMPLHPYSEEKMGREALILPAEIPLAEAVKIALQNPGPSLDGSTERVEFSRANLVGENYSLIYFPFYVYMVQGNRENTVVVDAVSHKVVRGALPKTSPEEGADRRIPVKPLSFIPYRCPNCGWDLPFRPHTRIHLCRTCGRAWQEIGGEYREVAYSVSLKGVGEKIDAWTFLPFWRLTVRIKSPERTYRTLDDFYTLFPLPKVQDREELRKRAIRFYVPAFRIRNPAAVDKFAARMTRQQPLFDEACPGEFREIRAADVWLPLGEAMEMAQQILYSMTPSRARKTIETVRGAQLDLREGLLVWLPFKDKGLFLREAHTDLGIQKNTLELD
ncbi:MAG: hypothetical protein JRJ35_17540 [Deltaproteobacteria bacterium]|nr:hypothetical protein [Deltaproteobacteria bacterium]MBW1950728.1 hypothetical protein [Deltaproteobacteria bacterium]